MSGPRIIGLALAMAAWTVAGAAAPSVERGKYIYAAAGCRGCHTDVKAKGPELGGGRALKTRFGTFYTPNITPHPNKGIGGWSDGEFVRALRDGVSPEGDHYYPVFPYTSYTRMTEQDMLDLKAYIFTLPAVDRDVRPHEIDFPFGRRFLLAFWKARFFNSGEDPPDPARPAAWARGRYLVRALVHCGECHTPRGFLGQSDPDMALAGTCAGPEGGAIPNITPDPETGLGDWTADDLFFLLKTGMTPEGDFVGAQMGEVVQHGTSQLNDADLRAIAAYLRELTPVQHRIERAK